jgi:hypothetical protein
MVIETRHILTRRSRCLAQRDCQRVRRVGSVLSHISPRRDVGAPFVRAQLEVQRPSSDGLDDLAPPLSGFDGVIETTS